MESKRGGTAPNGEKRIVGNLVSNNLPSSSQAESSRQISNIEMATGAKIFQGNIRLLKNINQMSGNEASGD